MDVLKKKEETKETRADLKINPQEQIRDLRLQLLNTLRRTEGLEEARSLSPSSKQCKRLVWELLVTLVAEYELTGRWPVNVS